MSLALSVLGHLTGSLTPAIGTPSSPVAKNGDFGSMLASAVQNVNQLQTDSTQAIQSFLSGSGSELHTVALATQRAELALDLGVQVRNKVVSAYQEIMKMQL